MSRWPIDSHRVVPLPIDPPQPRSGGAYEPRVALRASIDGPRDFVVVNTHIDASGTDQWRRQEIVTVLAVADSASDILLLGGDLNSTPESAIQASVRGRGYRDAWDVCGNRTNGYTYPADSGIKRIDYLYFRPSVSCARATVLPSQASDHRALLVILRP